MADLVGKFTSYTEIKNKGQNLESYNPIQFGSVYRIFNEDTDSVDTLAQKALSTSL